MPPEAPFKWGCSQACLVEGSSVLTASFSEARNQVFIGNLWMVNAALVFFICPRPGSRINPTSLEVACS